MISSRLPLIVIILFLNACSGNPPVTPTPTSAPTLTLTAQLHLDDASCDAFNADDTLILSQYHGIYDVATGEQVIAADSSFDLSPDNQYVAIDNYGVYELSTGQMLFTLPLNTGEFSFIPTFSPDSTKVVAYDGVYAVPSGERVVNWTTENIYAFFSPDSRYVVLLGDGVYDLQTGGRYFATATEYDRYSPHATFTRDGSRLILSDDGVYDMSTGERLFQITSFMLSADETMLGVSFGGLYYTQTGEPVLEAQAGYALPVLSPDQTLAAISDEDILTDSDGLLGAVYDIATGQQRFTYESLDAEFSPSGRYLIAAGDGIYEVASGERLYEFDEDERFTIQPGADRYLVTGQGVYDLPTRELLYTISGETARFSPDGRLLFLADGIHDASNGALLLAGTFMQGAYNADYSLVTVNAQNGCDVYRVAPAS